MHIRYNESAQYYEYSSTGTDQGPWTILPLANNVGGALANVAYRNIDNNFVAQTLATGSFITGTASYLYFTSTSAAAGNKNWRIINYSDGILRFERMNDSLAVTNTSFIGTDNSFNTNQVNCSNVLGNNVYSRNASYFWPGRVDIAADGNIQTNWYLAGHGSYGLFTNTGFYATGNIWTAGGYLEYGRGTVQGAWVTHTLNTGNVWCSSGAPTVGNVYISAYTLVGKTVFWNVYVNLNLSAITTNIYIVLPAGTTTAAHLMGVSVFYNGGAGGNGGVEATATLNYVTLRRNLASAQWSAGDTYIGFQVSYVIN